MGVAFMLGMARTLRQGAHIRVKLLFDAVGPRTRRCLDFIATGIAFGMVAILSVALLEDDGKSIFRKRAID